MIVRVYGDEGTPVPIPNTVVKLINGENTWLETARENNTARIFTFLNSSVGRGIRLLTAGSLVRVQLEEPFRSLPLCVSGGKFSA